MTEFTPDWTLSTRDRLAVTLSLSLYKNIPGWPGATDEQLAAVADDALASLRSRVEALEARLEITHAWRWDDASEELVRYEIPAEQRATFPDGIACRDATIALGDEQFKRLKVIKTEQAARIEALEVALAACPEFAEMSARHFDRVELNPAKAADRQSAIDCAVACRDVAWGLRRHVRSVLSEKQP